MESQAGAQLSTPSASCPHLYPYHESGPRPRAGPNTVEVASRPNFTASSAAWGADNITTYMPCRLYSSCPA